MDNTVVILMATYNGAAYLSEQLDSILSQTYTNWQLLIRDDGSSDNTVATLNEYQAKDSRIKLLALEGGHGSAAINFSVLFNYASTQNFAYLMFSDQDDIWNADKIAVSLNFIQQQEMKDSANLPVLIYSSFQFVDSHGKVIRQELPIPDRLTIPVLLTGNHAYGCTMILNKSLLERIGSIPETAEFHDYWVSLVACLFGKAILNPVKLVQYRQHDHNASGNVKKMTILSRFKRYAQRSTDLLPFFTRHFKMINLFYKRYQESLNPVQKTLILGYLDAFNKSNIGLMTFMLRHKLKKVGFLQTLAHYYTLLHLRKRIANHK